MMFKSVEIQNFMSIKTAQINLDEQGLVLIRGINEDNPNFMSNGAGKSTIIESLVYVLFGRTLRGVKGDDVVSKTANKNCKVVLDLVDDDGTEYRISRYRKHHQNKNSVFLFCNGTDITPKSEADFTKKIIELLQTDFMTFTSSILYSAESFKFTQATDSELKSAFDVMLDLKIYSDCQEEVKTQLRELTSKKQKLDSKILEIGHRKDALEESKNKSKELADKYDSEELDLYKSRLQKYAELHFDNYYEFSNLPETVRARISGLMDNANEDEIVEIHTGIVSIEQAVSQYINKYARTTKVSDLVLAFNEDFVYL